MSTLGQSSDIQILIPTLAISMVISVLFSNVFHIILAMTETEQAKIQSVLGSLSRAPVMKQPGSGMILPLKIRNLVHKLYYATFYFPCYFIAIHFTLTKSIQNIIINWDVQDIFGSLGFTCQYKEYLFKIDLFRGGTLLLLCVILHIFLKTFVCLSKFVAD